MGPLVSVAGKFQFLNLKFQKFDYWSVRFGIFLAKQGAGDVAHFGRAPPLHGGGSRFDPGRLHRIYREGQRFSTKGGFAEAETLLGSIKEELNRSLDVLIS